MSKKMNRHSELSQLTRKELRAIARECDLKIIYGLRKNKLIEAILEAEARNKTRLSFTERANDFVKNNQWLTALVGFVIMVLSFVITAPQKAKESKEILFGVSTESPVFDQNKKGLKVLILPFYKDGDNTSNLKIEETIERRLLEMSEKDNLELQVAYAPKLTPPKTISDGRKLGMEHKVDLVLWGDIFNGARDREGRISYVLLKDVSLAIDRQRHSEHRTIASMAQIRDGHLQADIDYIIYWTLGMGAYSLNDNRVALRRFEKIPSKFGEIDAVLNFYKANACFELSMFKQARHHYEKALKLDPEFARAHNNLALLLDDHFSEFKKARMHFLRALKIMPEYAAAHNNLAILLKNHFEEYKKARIHYERSLALNPGYADAHYNLAILLENHFNAYKDARKHYGLTLKYDPDYAFAHNNLAILLENRFKARKEARTHYRKAIAINPEYAFAHNNLAILLENHFKDYNGARTHYERALEIAPGYADAHANLACLLANNFQEFDMARTLIKKAIAMAPTNGSYYAGYAEMLADYFKEYRLAKKYYKKAISLGHVASNTDLKELRKKML